MQIQIQKNFIYLSISQFQQKNKYIFTEVTKNKMEQEFYNPYRLFRIPELPQQLRKESKTQDKVIIGLIDCSGSMGSFWKDMVKFWNQSIAEQANILITFSQKAKLEDHPYLNENIKEHGGGMTNILDAFRLLQIRLDTLPQNASITIIFISDGQDTVNGQAKLQRELKHLKGGQNKDITFLCLGIKSGFPTFISLQLRKLYHTGDQKIPAVFLIEYASQKAFFNKFETMSNCFKAKNKISVPDAGQYCKQFPWDKPGELVFQEGKWIMVHKQFKTMNIIYNDLHKCQYEVNSVDAIPLEDLVQCFRGWVQKVQFLSMDNAKMGQTQKIAAQTARTMRQFTKQYEQILKLYIISENPTETKETFKVRAMNLAIKNVGSRIKWFLDQLDIIAKGSGIGQLSQYEAAKRIAIGTITGKYHQKALALKGITAKDFQEIKQQFETIFKKIKLSEKPSQQEPSIFTLQNQKQVFQELDFLEGLQYCKTQFDLVETFPIVGYSLKIKRYDGSMINPWKVRLQALAKHHKTIDSMYLAKNDNKYELSVGNDQIEEINAVLPLFDINDQEMSPLFNTRLFKLAISFMVVQNIDTYHQEALLALLGATFIYVLRQPNSQWRNDLLDKIYTTIKVTYGQTQQFKKFIKDVQTNPFNLFKAKSQEDHVDIIKVMLIAFYVYKEGILEKQKALHLVDLALVHFTEKTYVENQFKIYRVAEIKVSSLENLDNFEKIEKIKENNMLKDEKQLKIVVDKEVENLLGSAEIEVELNEKIFRHEDEERRVVYPHIDRFYQYFYGKRLEKNDMLFYFGHYLKGKNQENYNTPVEKSLKVIKKICAGQVKTKDLSAGDGKRIKKIRKIVENKFVEHFCETHFGILPTTKQRLIQLCEKQNYNKNDYDLNYSTGLIRNTCMSPHCLYYMKKMTPKQVHDHLGLWRGQIPARFHMNVVFQLKAKRSPQQICEDVIKSGLVREKKHKKGKQFVLGYIKEIASTM